MEVHYLVLMIFILVVSLNMTKLIFLLLSKKTKKIVKGISKLFVSGLQTIIRSTRFDPFY